MKNFAQFALSMAFLTFSTSGFSQSPSWKMEVSGAVRLINSKSADKEQTLVSVSQDGKTIEKITSGENGKYALSLSPDHLYSLTFSHEGFVSKIIEISTRNGPSGKEVSAKEKYKVNIDIELLKEKKNVDISVFKKPVGKIFFNTKTKKFDYDRDYTDSISKELEKAKAGLEKP
jgi:hypothetical protein